VPVSAKLLKTSTFRLAAIYLALFALSVVALLAYVYWNTVGILERQADETISAEVQALADQYREKGITGIAETIQRRSQEDTASIYLLAKNDGTVVAGNLQSEPPEAKSEAQWINFPFVVKRGGNVEMHAGRAFHADLEGEYDLIVGRDVEELQQFENIIRRTLIWALGIALALGLGGGLLMSRNFLQRVDAITDASHSIMQGNLSGRMPVTGSGDELDRLAGSLNQMLDQIERLMNGMREVSSNVAHDLRTPLTRMKARVESALRTGNESEYRDALNKTIEESDRLLGTFNALLSIARAESGQSLTDVAELYEPIAEETGANLKLETTGPMPVRADRELLAQTIANLVDNAIKYGGPGQILIEGKSAGATATISVSDRGEGIPLEDRERVLGRFVRLDSSRSKPGNGLGLSLVAGVVKLHGGTLELADNKPGLRATITLPLQSAA
jgi:signal transduction histidine kinase